MTKKIIKIFIIWLDSRKAMEGWGSLLMQYYGNIKTASTNDDLSRDYLSYWSDNGKSMFNRLNRIKLCFMSIIHMWAVCKENLGKKAYFMNTHFKNATTQAFAKPLPQEYKNENIFFLS